MFDLPKAAHFIICKNGQRVAPDETFGLNIRWGMASWCREIGITDMLNLTFEQWQTIVKKCSQENERMKNHGLEIQLNFGYPHES